MAKTFTRARLLSPIVAAIGVIALLAPLPSVASVPQSGRALTATTIATGLMNPRGLTWNRGALYVAEAGKGGSGPCAKNPEGTVCFGASGAISRIRGNQRQRIVTGLPSLADPEGRFALGPHHVATAGGKLITTVGLGGNLLFRKAFGPAASGLGRLFGISRHGTRERLADVARYEATSNPDQGRIDSNPYGLWESGGEAVLTDAGGNSLLRVDRSGHISKIAVFPTRTVTFQGKRIPMQSVPTTVVKGPGGAYYVGELTGFPFRVGAARVYRVIPGQAPTVYAGGFTNIIDIAFDGQGRLYVLEIAHNSLLADNPVGALIRVDKDGSRTILMSKGLFYPGGLLVRSPHNFYVTNCGICATAGKVLQLKG